MHRQCHGRMVIVFIAPEVFLSVRVSVAILAMPAEPIFFHVRIQNHSFGISRFLVPHKADVIGLMGMIFHIFENVFDLITAQHTMDLRMQLHPFKAHPQICRRFDVLLIGAQGNKHIGDIGKRGKMIGKGFCFHIRTGQHMNIVPRLT